MCHADASFAPRGGAANPASPTSDFDGIKVGGRSHGAGYRYHCGANRAVWLPGRRIVVFFREGGRLLGIKDVTEEAAEQAA